VKGPTSGAYAGANQKLHLNGHLPKVARPDTAVAQPDIAEPDTAEPDTAEPDTAEPDIAEPAAAEPEAEDAQTEDAQPAPDAPAKKKMKRGTRTALIFIVVLALLAALGLGTAYYLYSQNFVSTDNAQVDGDKIEINAPATGMLVDWQGTQGSTVTPNQIVGRVKVGSSTGVQMPIKAPGSSNGTIAVNNVVNGQWVTAGTQLATAYDLSKVYVTARVDDTDIDAVHLGAPVDITVDSSSGSPVTGVVTEIQGAAADEFSLFPQSNSTGNFQKVTQVIPVRIAFTNTDGLRLVPGMNVTVHIHKQP
jgi:multidrug resistance efflux pump